MLRQPFTPVRRRVLAGAPLMLFCLAGFVGCGGAATPTTTDTGTPDLTALKGSISGNVADSTSTRDSIDSTSATQTLPLTVDPEMASVTFEDLSGAPLLDANGAPFPPATFEANGDFFGNGLPVGVDFVVAADLGGDGVPDVRQIVQIPANEDVAAGALVDVSVDPLTTLVVAKLRELFEENGVNPEDLGISPVAIVERIVDAFVHLFEETGVDRGLTLDDVSNLSAGDVAALFDSLLPEVVRAGMNTVEGNLRLEKALDIEGSLMAAAEVFVRAGFPILDEPGGIDLSFLGDLPGIEPKSFDELFGFDPEVVQVAQFESIGLDATDFDTLLADGTLDELLNGRTLEEVVADGTLDDLLGAGTIDGLIADGTLESLLGAPGAGGMFDAPEGTIYVSSVSEPNRNFAANSEFGDDGFEGNLPFLNEFLLRRMARFHLEGRTITLGNLHRLITDPTVGLGARLTYFRPGDFNDGPGRLVFETTDGAGVERDVDSVIFALFDQGLAGGGDDFETLETKTGAIRQTMADLVAGTIPPTIRRLFGALLSDRIENIDQVLGFIRKARAHLPFSRSGPSSFFVVADGDAFGPNAANVNAVSVDVTFDAQDHPVSVTYNPTNTGRFYVGFTHDIETSDRVELLIRETGRWLRGIDGRPLVLNMGDSTVFGPIDGVPFAEFVTEEGTFWPGIPVSVANPDHRLDNDFAEAQDFQLFVLATTPGPDGVPVRVNYDIATGAYTNDPNGRYYLTFVEETPDLGLFGLYDIELNFMASVEDLTGTRFIDIPPPDEEFFIIDGTMPPPDGTMPPPDSVTTTTDGTVSTTTDDPMAPQTAPSTTDTTITDVTTTDEIIVDEQLPPGPFVEFAPALVGADQVLGLALQREFFRFVYGTEVPNENFDASGNPFYDDVNGNSMEDAGELTADFRPTLFDPRDWRSTDVSRYYRRASGAAVGVNDIDWDSDVPQTLDGEALVARSFLPRRNAFRFGRPNTAINLLTTFLPGEFFDGTHSFTPDTKLGIFQAIAMINLAMDQVFNIEGVIDFDGQGPAQPQRMLVDAQLFVLPIGDPFVLLLEGFDRLSERPQQ